jgi:hypothetical protein
MFRMPAYDPFAIAVLGFGISFGGGVCISLLMLHLTLAIGQSSVPHTL